jgi:hypothetical protein
MMTTPDTAAPTKDAKKPTPAEVDAHKLAERKDARNGKTFQGTQGKEVHK